MPTPGSHAHDVKRQRLRKELESQGFSDEEAEERARRELADDAGGPSPAATSDRAQGPYGERTGGGDPGAVIELRSPGFSGNTMIPSRHTRSGDNTSPALEWSDLPDGTAELVLRVEDRDAPDGPFTHWLVTGIDPATNGVDEGSEPPGTVWPNSFGERRYDGPEPPIGDDPHRYFFEVVALDEPLALEPGAPEDELRKAVEGRKLAAGTLIGSFAR